MRLEIGIAMIVTMIGTAGLAQGLPPPLVPPNQAPTPEAPAPKSKAPASETKSKPAGIKRPTATLPKPDKGCTGQIAVMDPDQLTVTDFMTDRSCTFLIGTYDIAGFDIGDMVTVDIDKGTNTVQKMEKEKK